VYQTFFLLFLAGKYGKHMLTMSAKQNRLSVAVNKWKLFVGQILFGILTNYFVYLL
jgi:hypothetical protein